MTKLRQNFPHEVETAINRQIHFELRSSYAYLVMAFHFERNDVALCNVAKWFSKQSAEERQQAHALMSFQNGRGGRVALERIDIPNNLKWCGGAFAAFQTALQLEKISNDALLSLHKSASTKGDSQTCDFLEQNFLVQQVNLIEQIGKVLMMITPKIFRICEFLDDKEFMRHKVESAEELNKFLAHLKRVGKNLGDFIFDKELDEKIPCLCECDEEKNDAAAKC